MRIDWKAPVPLQSADQVVNEYPISVFPFWAQNMIREVSESKGVPIDMPAHAFVSVISAIIAGHVSVLCYEKPKPTGLWTLLLAPSGTGKDLVNDLMGEPLEKIETYKEYSLGNTSLTSLSEHMSNSLEKSIIFDSEGAFYELMMECKDPTRTQDLFHMYDGKTVRIDRHGQTPIFLQHPNLILALSTQNDTFAYYQKKKQFTIALGRGLAQRFLYCAPDCSVCINGNIKKNVDDIIAFSYFLYIDWLYALVSEPGDIVLRFDSNKTQEHFNQICAGYRNQKVSSPDVNEFMNVYLSKLDDKLIRLMAILTLSFYIDKDHHDKDGNLDLEITDVILNSTERLVQYYLTEYRKLFSPYTPDANRAEIIVKYFQKPEHRTDAVKSSELWSNIRRTKGMDSKKCFDEALDTLEAHHYIVKEEQRNPGARSSLIIHVNPAIYHC